MQTISIEKFPKYERMKRALRRPELIIREANNRSLFQFIKYFWSEISNDPFTPNWHIQMLCQELEEIAYRVANRLPKKHDLIVNIPPGTTKTITISIMFPVWCWTKWYWMRFITGSYSGDLSLESAESSRDIIRSEKFQKIYPYLGIKEDKDTKGNYKVIKKRWYEGVKEPMVSVGGNRFSTSIGAKLTGFHGHILIVDDPIDPTRAVSEVERQTANRWTDQTLSTRKTDKQSSTIITVMQRIHSDDPTGHMLNKRKTNIRHISLPGEIVHFKQYLKPPELEKYYVDGLLDKNRMPWSVLEEMEADLGQYGYRGQVGQAPTSPGTGMFKVDMFSIVHTIPGNNFIVRKIRFWDKAGTKELIQKKNTKKAAYTVGTLLYLLKDGKIVVADVKRGRWSSDEREKIMRATAEADGRDVTIYHEQEPGSGGKQSAEQTNLNLSGFSVYADLPVGDKIYRADPYSVQVNNGNVSLLYGEWNKEFIDEHRDFPNSTYKDQVDSASGAFNKLTGKRKVKALGT